MSICEKLCYTPTLHLNSDSDSIGTPFSLIKLKLQQESSSRPRLMKCTVFFCLRLLKMCRPSILALRLILPCAISYSPVHQQMRFLLFPLGQDTRSAEKEIPRDCIHLCSYQDLAALEGSTCARSSGKCKLCRPAGSVCARMVLSCSKGCAFGEPGLP